jgi:hypothetical protein
MKMTPKKTPKMTKMKTMTRKKKNLTPKMTKMKTMTPKKMISKKKKPNQVKWITHMENGQGKACSPEDHATTATSTQCWRAPS